MLFYFYLNIKNTTMTQINKIQNQYKHLFSFEIYYTHEKSQNINHNMLILKPDFSVKSIINFLDYFYKNNWKVSVSGNILILTIQKVSYKQYLKTDNKTEILNTFKDLVIKNLIKKYIPKLENIYIEIPKNIKIEYINKNVLFDMIQKKVSTLSNVYINKNNFLLTDTKKEYCFFDQYLRNYEKYPLIQ